MRNRRRNRKRKLYERENDDLNFSISNNDDELWQDWQNIMTETHLIDKEISDEIVEFVENHTKMPKAAPKNNRLFVGIAASIIIIIGIGGSLLFFSKSRGIRYDYSTKTTESRNDHSMREEWNNDKRDKQVVLPDHSTVILHPGGSIKYNRKQFDNNDSLKRDIYLTGSAYFKVAKNPLKPFTVYSGNLSTTALGTEFDILKNNGNTTVKLYRGKVVVKALNKQKGWTKDVYLTQGETVALNNSIPKEMEQVVSLTAAVDNKARKSIQSKETIQKELLPLTCENMPIKEVLETLEKYYHININYSSGLVKDKYFTGEILREKSPDIILGIICNMQNLQIDKTDSGYVIHQ